MIARGGIQSLPKGTIRGRTILLAIAARGVPLALGYGTTGVAVGDPVYGLTDWYRDGAAAEYVSVEARNLARKPDKLDHRAAAAVPMVALTAQQALFDHGRLATGQTVAVLGAGGGVGTFAVQLARAAGARVAALARKARLTRAAQLSRAKAA